MPRLAVPADDPPTPAADGGIPLLHYSTDHLPADERYADWLNRDWPRPVQIYRTEPAEPFDTSWDSVQLGPITVVYTQITAMRWERRPQDIRRSDFDPIVVSMMIEGSAHGDMDGRPFRVVGGMLHFHDLARPSVHVSSATRTCNIVIPRPLAEERFGSLRDLHGLIIGRPTSDMLFSGAAEIRTALSRLQSSAAEGLGVVLLELIVIALLQARPSPAAPESREAALRRRAEQEIDSRIGIGTNVAELCEVLGVSRRRLFAAFSDSGGIHSYVMGARLERVRAALEDIDRSEPIGDIAHRLGFSDSSHLSRSFRLRFGMSPREYRRLAATDRPERERGQ